MANYENGVATRQAIIDTCITLFLEKGYHETSYADICRDAHVNRTTIYYHFKDKEQMRYEVQHALTDEMKNLVERYCDRPEYHYLLTVYLLWYRIKTDEKFRRFQYSCCIDYPLMSKKEGFVLYYIELCERMWSPFFDSGMIPDLSFASFYGYIICCIRMLCEQPQHYDAAEMFERCCNSCIFIWGVPADSIPGIWADVKRYIAKIPKEEIPVSGKETVPGTGSVTEQE